MNKKSNPIQELQKIRDGLGAGSILIASKNEGILDYIINKETFTLKILLEELKCKEYKIKPIISILEQIGILKEKENTYIVHEQKEYVDKMLASFPLYNNTIHYFSKTTPKNLDSITEQITKSSSRLAKPAITQLIESEAYLKHNTLNILDIGCGRGDYGILLAKQNPNISVIGIEQVPSVAKIAKQNTIAQQVEKQVKIYNQDFLTSKNISHDFDIIMMNHIYHFVGEELSRKLTKKGNEHLKTSGKFFNLELCLDYPYKNILHPHLFDAEMRMYFSENKGKCFSKNEIIEIMLDYNFKINKILPLNFDTKNMTYFIGEKIDEINPSCNKLQKISIIKK